MPVVAANSVRRRQRFRMRYRATRLMQLSIVSVKMP